MSSGEGEPVKLTVRFLVGGLFVLMIWAGVAAASHSAVDSHTSSWQSGLTMGVVNAQFEHIRSVQKDPIADCQALLKNHANSEFEGCLAGERRSN